MALEKDPQTDTNMETFTINGETHAVENAFTAELPTGRDSQPRATFKPVRLNRRDRVRTDDDMVALEETRRKVKHIEETLEGNKTALERASLEVTGFLTDRADDLSEGGISTGITRFGERLANAGKSLANKLLGEEVQTDAVQREIPLEDETVVWQTPLSEIERDSKQLGVKDKVRAVAPPRKAQIHKSGSPEATRVTNNREGKESGVKILPADLLQQTSVALAKELGVSLPRDNGKTTPEHTVLDATVQALNPDGLLNMAENFFTGRLSKSAEMAQLAPAVLSVAAEKNVVDQVSNNIKLAAPVKRDLLLDYTLSQLNSALPGQGTQQKGRQQIIRATQEVLEEMVERAKKYDNMREIPAKAVYDVSRLVASEQNPYKKMAMTAVNRALMQHTGQDIHQQGKNPNFNKAVATAWEIGKRFAADTVPYIVPVRNGILGPYQDLSFKKAPAFSEVYALQQMHALTNHIADLGQPSMAMAMDGATAQATQTVLTPEAKHLQQTAQGYMNRRLEHGISNLVKQPAAAVKVIPPALQEVANDFNPHVVRLANLTLWAPVSEGLKTLNRPEGGAFVRQVDETLQLQDAVTHGTHRQEQADQHIATLLPQVLHTEELDEVPTTHTQAGEKAKIAVAAASLDMLTDTGNPDIGVSTVRAIIKPLSDNWASRRPQVAVLGNDERVGNILERSLKTALHSTQADAVWDDYRGAIGNMMNHVVNHHTIEPQARRDEGPVEQGLVNLVKAVPRVTTPGNERTRITFVARERNGSISVEMVPLQDEIGMRKRKLEKVNGSSEADMTQRDQLSREIEMLQREADKQRNLDILNNSGSGIKSLSQVGVGREQVAVEVTRGLIETGLRKMADANKLQSTASVNSLMQTKLGSVAARNNDALGEANTQGAIIKAATAANVAEKIQSTNLQGLPAILKTTKEVLGTVGGDLQMDIGAFFEAGIEGISKKEQTIVITI